MADWKVSDRAVCVDDGDCPCCGEPCGVRTGQVYTVAGLVIDPSWGGELFLELTELSPTSTVNHARGNVICAEAFRKIVPDEHEPCEPEFVALLRRQSFISGETEQNTLSANPLQSQAREP